VRRSHPETVLKLLGLLPGKQIIALRAGEIDIGVTNESGELLAGEFYTRKLAEEGSYIALPEQLLTPIADDALAAKSASNHPGFNRDARSPKGVEPNFLERHS
jgi:hypothetical protein